MSTGTVEAPPVDGRAVDIQSIPVIRDTHTFDDRQAMRLREMERRMQEEIRRKEREWEQKVERMREDFLTLHPCDTARLQPSNGDSTTTQPDLDEHVTKLCGSTEVLNIKKMKTLFFEYPDSERMSRSATAADTSGTANGEGEKDPSTNHRSRSDSRRRYQLRFNLSGFEPQSVRMTTDGSRIVVQATRTEENEHGIAVESEYFRKIQKPKEINHAELKSYLSADGILIIEAPMATKASFVLGRMSHSMSQSSHGSKASKSSSRDTKSDSSETPSKEKIGVPIFRDENGARRMQLTVELGSVYTPEDITVQVIKENRIQIRAKHREKTNERLSKSKFLKDYELGEKIETYSLKGGLTSDGKLIVGAFAKGHGEVPG